MRIKYKAVGETRGDVISCTNEPRTSFTLYERENSRARAIIHSLCIKNEINLVNEAMNIRK